MRIRYVADGDRDHWMLPALVQTIIGAHDEGGFLRWRDIQLQGGLKGGLGRKLQLVVRAAEQENEAVVATVDRDATHGERLRELQQHRGDPSIPVALGEANPHGEAWLVDDIEPLRTHLGLGAEEQGADRRNPKKWLDGLVARADRGSASVVYPRLAADVRLKRCTQAKRTGFRAFVTDLEDQFRP